MATPAAAESAAFAREYGVPEAWIEAAAANDLTTKRIVDDITHTRRGEVGSEENKKTAVKLRASIKWAVAIGLLDAGAAVGTAGITGSFVLQLKRLFGELRTNPKREWNSIILRAPLPVPAVVAVKKDSSAAEDDGRPNKAWKVAQSVAGLTGSVAGGVALGMLKGAIGYDKEKKGYEDDPVWDASQAVGGALGGVARHVVGGVARGVATGASSLAASTTKTVPPPVHPTPTPKSSASVISSLSLSERFENLVDRAAEILFYDDRRFVSVGPPRPPPPSPRARERRLLLTLALAE